MGDIRPIFKYILYPLFVNPIMSLDIVGHITHIGVQIVSIVVLNRVN